MITASRFLIVSGILSLAALTAKGQGKQQAVPPTPQPAVEPAKGVGGATLAQPVDPATYIIGVEDVLEISVFEHPEVSKVVGVRSDGKITLPLLDDVQADGLTPNQLKKTLTEGFFEIAGIKSPLVTVTVNDVKSKKYTMAGKIGKPGPYALVTPIKIFEAIVLAGGPVEFAKDKDILVLRGNDTLHFNYRDYKKSKNRDKLDFDLKSGDIVMVN